MFNERIITFLLLNVASLMLNMGSIVLVVLKLSGVLRIGTGRSTFDISINLPFPSHSIFTFVITGKILYKGNISSEPVAYI